MPDYRFYSVSWEDKKVSEQDLKEIQEIPGIRELHGWGGIQINMKFPDMVTCELNKELKLNTSFLKKQEDRRTELNIKAKAIDQEGTEFQRKLQNNGFISEARAIEARDQLLVKQENFRRLQQEMMDKASREQSELNKQLFDEITNFLKEYNKEKGFSIVLSTQLGGNVLYAEDGFDITKEIVDRLNANYKKGDSQK